MMEPIVGFADPAISTMFNPPAPSPTTSTSSTTDASDGDRHKKTNVGAIVGAAAGGTVGLIIAICVIVCILRRRRNRSSPPEALHTDNRVEYPDIRDLDTDNKRRQTSFEPEMKEKLKEDTSSPFSELSPDGAFYELPAEYPFYEMPLVRPSMRIARSADPPGKDQGFEIVSNGPHVGRAGSTA